MYQLLKLLANFGWAKPKDTYEPEFDGQWVNKGTEENERYVWNDFSKPKIQYINIFKVKGGHKLVLSDEPIDFAMDVIKCSDQREADIALNLNELYYKVLGEVFIDKPKLV